MEGMLLLNYYLIIPTQLSRAPALGVVLSNITKGGRFV